MATRRTVRTLADQLIEVTDGDEVGYGIVEYGVGKGCALYEARRGIRRSERFDEPSWRWVAASAELLGAAASALSPALFQGRR